MTIGSQESCEPAIASQQASLAMNAISAFPSSIVQNSQGYWGRVVLSHSAFLASSNEEDARLFARLSKEWENATGGLSNIWRRMKHPAFREIMKMHNRAIPFMLKDFERGRYEDWFIWLALLTGDNPILPAAAGKKSEMAKAWIQWGKVNHYLTD